MPHDIPWWRRPGVRLRHDMHLWIRHDAARFVRPGFDPADVFPTLARKPDAAKEAPLDPELAAEVAKGYRLNAVLREEVAEIRADIKRRRALALTQIRQYDPEWEPREQSLTSPGSVEGAIARAEARAAEAETRLDQLRTGIGGNRGPLLDPSPSGAPLSPRVFDGGAWIDAYRSINNGPDLFGRPMWPYDKGTVAAGEIDGKVYFGVNSTAPGYSNSDLNRALDARDNLIAKYPKVMEIDDIGQKPNDSLFHAEIDNSASGGQR
jgi:hypothetical protein